MIDDVHHDGEDAPSATEKRSGELRTDEGQDTMGGIEVFGAAPLVDDEDQERADSVPSDDPSDGTSDEPQAPESPVRASDTVAETLSLLDHRLASIEEQLDGLSRMTGHLPPKLRGLGSKLDELATPLADAGTRSLMVDLFMLDDLSRAALQRDDDPDAPNRALGAVVKMLENLFEQRDVTTIPTDIPFDPTLHQALERLPVDDPAHDGQILEVYRRGYRSGSRVLRFAEVGVAHYEPDSVADDD